MRRIYLILIFLTFVFVSCTSKSESLPVTSIRFTPLNFPYSPLGEFTLSQSTHAEQLDIFLEVIQNAFSTADYDDTISLQELPDTFSLQLFSDTALTAIYRLSFDFEQDIAFLQNDSHIYKLNKSDFYRLIETGYFNVFFQKNHAPSATFLLDTQDIRYSVEGTWSYETYQNNFLSYQINNKLSQSTNYIVTEIPTSLQVTFGDKQPDEIYETISTADSVVSTRNKLESENLSIPEEENTYFYEVEAIWSNSAHPYRATLTYRFQLIVNYPPRIRMTSSVSAGSVVAIQVDNYDKNGKVIAESPLWESPISLYLNNNQYYGLLPIPIDTQTGQYEIWITGSNSTEPLKHIETVTVSGLTESIVFVRKTILEQEEAREKLINELRQLHTQNSYSEKLWNISFFTPATIAPVTSFGQTLFYQKEQLLLPRLRYPITGTFEIRASENGIIRWLEHSEEAGYTILIDHGLGIFSFYSGITDIDVSLGNFITAKQKIGAYTGETNPAILPFTYGMIAHGYFINPNIFRGKDPFSGLK